MSQSDIVGEKIAEVGAEDACEAEGKPESGVQQWQMTFVHFQSLSCLHDE
jgi:hypothetical protein